MSTEIELARIEQSLSRMASAMEGLTDAIQAMTVTNQKMLDVLIDVIASDDPDNQPMRDMEGNPI